ncbi:MAG: hypothetical protein QM831_22040 [Kofleriaceae bacterium]
MVVMVGCKEIDQTTRDTVSKKYDADNKAWHDLTVSSLDELSVRGWSAFSRSPAHRTKS